MLTAVLLFIALLALLAAAGPMLVRHGRGTGLVLGTTMLACAGLAAAGLAALLTGVPTAAPMPLPFGPPWGLALVALDGLSAWFLVLLGLLGAIACLFAIAHGAGPARALPPFPLFIAGMATTLVAADAFLLLFGFELMSLASWALVAADHGQAGNRRAARLYLIMAAFSAACLLPAFGLLAGHAGGYSFAALRAAPPEGGLAAGVLLLGLLGAGAKAGLVPLHAWLPLAHPAAPSHVSALMSGAMTKVAVYVLARLVLDLCGPGQPPWWGAPLLALGAASALLGALRANLEEDSKVLLACSTIENIGFITMALGMALAFRGADLGPLAALAVGAALLHALAHGLFKTLLFLMAGTVLHAAGSRLLDRLGGLVHAMPVTAGCALVGVLAAAGLPPLSGFAGEWLLLQSLLAGWRVGDVAFQVGAAAALAVAAMAAALAAAAMLRFFGLVFLGRPRTPRGAGAHEAKRLELLALLVPAVLTVLVGLLPAPLVQLAGPAIHALLPGSPPAPARGMALVAGPGDGSAAYAPLAIGLLLAALGAAVFVLVRRLSPLETRRGPVWNCGFIDPPPHLPFGDPLTQPTAGGIAQPLRRMLGESLLAARETVAMPPPGSPAPARHAAHFTDPSFPLLLAPLVRWREALAARAEKLRDFSIRQCLALSFGALVLLLALMALLEAR